MSKLIRFGEPIEVELLEEALPSERLIEILTPADAESIRRQRSSPFQVYICSSTFKDIWLHLVGSPDVETGGVLVGHPFRVLGNESKTFIVIVGSIRQDSDNRSVGHFTVNPREIATTRAEMEKKYPGLVAVGWYHSHPRHGIFLSGQDMIIVRSIYNAEWHVALVVDPTRKTSVAKFFRGSEGEELKGWLELTQVPISIVAIQKYNQAKEMLTQRRLKEAHQLLIELERLSDTSEMAHWRIRGGYRDIKTLLNRMPQDNPKSLPQPVSIPLAATTTSKDRQDYLSSRNIPEKYSQAKQLLAEAFEGEEIDEQKLRGAWQFFDWIHKTSPEYKDTKTLSRVTGWIKSDLETKSSPRFHRRSMFNDILNVFGDMEPTILSWLQDQICRNFDGEVGAKQNPPVNSQIERYEQQASQPSEIGNNVDEES